MRRSLPVIISASVAECPSRCQQTNYEIVSAICDLWCPNFSFFLSFVSMSKICISAFNPLYPQISSEKIYLQFTRCNNRTSALYHWPSDAMQSGSGTFRSPVFSLLGAKVPTFAPKNGSSREHSFRGANAPGNIHSAERYTGQRTVRVTSSYT